MYNTGRRHGKGHEGFPHADLVPQNDPRLMLEARKNGLGRPHLACCIGRRKMTLNVKVQ
jgi:hypothetical protein